MITRIRPAHDPDTLDKMYAAPHSTSDFIDHGFRVADTVAAVRAWTPWPSWMSAADLSCGDGAILNAIPAARKVYGDLAPHPDHQLTGPLESTLPRLEQVELYVCCETLEHLDDPLAVLQLIRDRAGFLLLSTPIDAWDDDNPEHYWVWNREGVEGLLRRAGFEPTDFTTSDHRASGFRYCFGIWFAS